MIVLTANSTSPYLDANDVKPTYTTIKHSERIKRLPLSESNRRIPCPSIAKRSGDSPFQRWRYLANSNINATINPVNCAVTVPSATPKAPIGV